MPNLGGSITIAGHKVPVLALVGGVIALAVLLVLRGKRGGAQVAAAGAAPAQQLASGLYGTGPSATQSDLATLQSQIEGELRQGLAAITPPAPVVSPTAINPTPTPIQPAPAPVHVQLADLASISRAMQTGQQIFYEPTQGNFVNVPYSAIYKGSGFNSTSPFDSLYVAAPAGTPVPPWRPG